MTFDLQITRNVEAFARLVDVPQLRFGRWHQCNAAGLWLYLDVLSETGSGERMRLTVAAGMPASRLSHALASVMAGASPRRYGCVPVRFFIASGSLMAAGLMPAHTTARQWFPIYSAMCRTLNGRLRDLR